MPVDPAILFHYSTEYPSLGNRHSIANASTRCWYLIDRIYNPWLMLQILSIGDLLLFAGIFITAVQVFVILHRKRHS